MKYLSALVLFVAFTLQSVTAQNVLSPEDLLGLNYVYGANLSPDGNHLIYTLSIPRTANEDAGRAHSETYVMNLKDGNSRLLFDRESKAYSARWSPDGKMIGFMQKDDDGIVQAYMMPAEGGEKTRISFFASSISSFKWNPNGKGIAFILREQASDREKELKKRGYGFIFYEENLKNNHLYYGELNEKGIQETSRKLTTEGNVWDFEFNAQGTQIAASISPQNLIDHKYMFRKIHVVNLESGAIKEVSKNEGKLGNYVFSPDGSKLAYAAALNLNDHQVSQAFVMDLEEGTLNNLTPENYRGHIGHVDWKNDKELVYHASEGVYSKLYTVKLSSAKRKLILNGEEAGIVFQAPQFNAKFKSFVFSGSTPSDRINLYAWNGKGDLKRITNINPVLEGKDLGEQSVIRFKASDGLEIEGVLIKPVGYVEGKRYPLIVFVHGGPESHHSNAWLSSYATPGQVMAGKGYMVAYFNYRASTGYGVDFAMEGLGDPAGKEFDDIVDGIEYLIKDHGADRNRIGLAGGSYGGYAAAWFATKHTRYVKAVGMFVGISDLISKRGTTDIPYEEMYVHSGKSLEEQWQMNLKRSPIYWAHQSKTATLIYGGAADTRVHPSQSMELYRRMKVNNHPAVRLVQYPGEGHGNRKQVGQIDVLFRQMAWFDWYVRDLKPLEGEMPPLDISDSYGLDWDY